jgi:hypothetical protein
MGTEMKRAATLDNKPVVAALPRPLAIVVLLSVVKLASPSPVMALELGEMGEYRGCQKCVRTDYWAC